MELDHISIIGRALTGRKVSNDQLDRSVAVLSDRLDHLKQLHSCFSSVAFSPDMEALVREKKIMAVS